MYESSNHVEQITVTLTLASGDQHTLTVHQPGPQGGNPRYLAQQIERGMDELTGRLDRLAETYAEQIRPGVKSDE